MRFWDTLLNQKHRTFSTTFTMNNIQRGALTQRLLYIING